MGAWIQLKAALSWQVKIGAEIVLSRLPVDYRQCIRLNLFKRGPLEDLEYSTGAFERPPAVWRADGNSGAFSILEFGACDSPLSASVAVRMVAKRSWIVETGSWASRDLTVDRRAARELFSDEEAALDWERWTRLEEMQEDCSATYLTQSIGSPRSLVDGPLDLLWSQSVLEHAGRAEVAETFVAFRLLLGLRGVCIHARDIKDHPNGRLHNLRLSDEVCEGDRFSLSGFYSHRFRCVPMLELARASALSPRLGEVKRWDSLRTPWARLDAGFRSLSEEDLAVSDAHLSLTCPVDARA